MSEESNDSKVGAGEQQLEEHKQIVIMTGNISDFQLKNLKTWPFILFDDVETVTIDYNFTETVKNEDGENSEGIGAGKVKFSIKSKAEPTEKAIETIKNWTKVLFWNDTVVEVNIVA